MIGFYMFHTCKNCKGNVRFYSSRGLCKRCFKDHNIRARFPMPKDRYARCGRRIEIDEHYNKEPDNRDEDWRATTFPPGSEGKVRAMKERCTKHQPLFHPGDHGRDGRPISESCDYEAITKGLSSGRDEDDEEYTQEDKDISLM